jgi:hypothetical protein
MAVGWEPPFGPPPFVFLGANLMTNPNFNIDVTVDDGKYRFTQDVDGAILVYRHGEPWIEGSFAGINMVIAMACELEELREELRPLRDEIGKAKRSLELFQAMADYIPRVALSQLWEMLEVDNQTAAVAALEELQVLAGS